MSHLHVAILFFSFPSLKRKQNIFALWSSVTLYKNEALFFDFEPFETGMYWGGSYRYWESGARSEAIEETLAEEYAAKNRLNRSLSYPLFRKLWPSISWEKSAHF